MRRAHALLVLALAVSLGGALTAASPAASGTPAKDRFSGQVSSASGAVANARGTLTVLLHPTGNATTRRRVRVQISGVGISGTAAGTLAPTGGHNPDTGRAYLLSATGTLTRLGPTTVQAVVHGAGFTARGTETMQLTLRGQQGRLSVRNAHSPSVPGFTSP